MSAVDFSSRAPLTPYYHPGSDTSESGDIQAYISTLSLLPHPEGGYYAETDRDPLRVPNPFANTPTYANATVKASDDSTRSASTTIYYYLTPKSPTGVFHRNKGRTVHTLHRGRGRYVVIHADETEDNDGKARVETFIVGQDTARGERLQWIVDGGKFKATFLLPDEEGGESSAGLLISETVVPGFEFCDHDFATPETLQQLVSQEQEAELSWLLREGR